MDKAEALNKMKILVQKLNEASKAYYQEDQEIMSNLEYDKLYEELEKLESSTGIQLTESPTAKVGYEAVEGLEKVSHEVPLLSLDKTKAIAKLVDFLGEHAGLLSWKLDGLTIVLIYENGVLVQAVTRGNGSVGEDVTHNARTFKNIPLRIPYTKRLLVRGEAVITYEDFETINSVITDETDKYKNPRNLCSGTVRQLDSSIAAERPIRYYAFSILAQNDVNQNDQKSKLNFDLKSHQLTFLSDIGFEVVEHLLSTKESVKEDVSAFRKKLSDLGMPSDGLVLTYDEIQYSISLGSTSKFPKDALAFKWADELVETTLRYIEWNTSRTGLINPIAVFDPIEIEGTTVNKAGLHNVSIVRQLELGENDKITVYKANMIIPQVAENKTRSNTALLPEKCPVCQGSTEILKQKGGKSDADGEIGEVLYCLNPSCQAQLIGSLVHFCSRNAMNIEGLSEQTLEKWVDRGFVSDYTDIFALESYEDKITQMEGFGQKSFNNLMTSIERAKDVPLANFIFALGIKHVGLSNAKLLCEQFGDIETIIEKSQDIDALLSIKGFGEAIANSLQVYFADTKNLAMLEKIKDTLRIKSAKKIDSEALPGKLQGLTFVITGSVNHFNNRKALQAFIEEHDGKCTGSVSASTSYLINNDTDSSSSKNKKAQSLEIPILTETMFLDLIRGH
ncbi:MAG: NAD-dependent DNA ligase LigA [Defluviitaleaceae bacterium]|nr:NAD-dependent DNA ligase LigA [Defluviitaleaceae bacterium]